MAILKFGLLVAGIRGTIGGTIFSANGAGPYARTWARPPRSTTLPQQHFRQLFSGWGPAWRALTDTQRNDWRDWAAHPDQELVNALGEPYYISGWNWFILQNTGALLSHRPALYLDPPNTGPPGSLGVTPDFTAPATATVENSSFPEDGDSWLFYLQPKTPQASSWLSNPWHFIGGLYEPAPGAPIDISAAVIAQTGTLAVGQQFWFRTVRMDADRRIGTPATQSLVVI